MKRWRSGIFPGNDERGPLATFFGNGLKKEPKEIPSRFIPHLLVVCTWQLEILVTSLFLGSVFHHDIQVH